MQLQKGKMRKKPCSGRARLKARSLLKLVLLLLGPGAQECPSEAETDEPGIAIVVGVEALGVEVCSFDVEFVVTYYAVTAIEANGELIELEASFEFCVERGGDGAIVAVAHDDFFRGRRIGDDVVRREVDVHHVETDTHSRNQVEEFVFAENLPAEHPVRAIVEPACVVEREVVDLSVLVHAVPSISFCLFLLLTLVWSFGNLRYCKVDVEPSQELLVLCTNIKMEGGIELVKRVVGRGGEESVD